MLSPVAGQAPILCMAVFDGHGILGHLAAASCRRALPVVLYDLIGKGCDLQTALKETIAQLHEALNEDARMIRATVHSSLALQSSQGGAAAASFSSTANTTLAEPLSRRSHSRSGSSTPTSPSKVPTGGLFGNDYGTTAIVVLVQDTTVWIANVGDSRCVMMQREAKHGDSPSISSTATTPPSQPEDWMIVHESLEDNCDSESERKRVQQDGGALFHTGTEYRVYPASMDFQAARSQQLTLNMSRSLGHIKLGQCINRTVVIRVTLLTFASLLHSHRPTRNLSRAVVPHDAAVTPHGYDHRHRFGWTLCQCSTREDLPFRGHDRFLISSVRSFLFCRRMSWPRRPFVRSSLATAPHRLRLCVNSWRRAISGGRRRSTVTTSPRSSRG
jgi:hypothetical protein